MGLFDDTSLFHKVPDAEAVIQTKKGIFKQVPVYFRGQHIYAGFQGGFIRLHDNGGTSNPDVRCDSLITPGVEWGESKMGRLVVKSFLELPGPVRQLESKANDHQDSNARD